MKCKNKVWNKVICSILTNFTAEMYFSSEEKYIFLNNALNPGQNLRLSPLRYRRSQADTLGRRYILVLEQETGDEVIGAVYAGGVESSKVEV